MTEQDTTNDHRVVSYLTLRKAIGIIGFFLPIVLIFGDVYWFQGPGIRDSISSYYYSRMGDVLVGSLCAIGVFLISYRGYDTPRGPRLRRLFGRSTDYLASTIAGVGAIGVALFPTQDESATLNELTIGDESDAGIHVLSAAVFFIFLAYILIWRFTDHGPANDDPIAETSRRRCNVIYVACGLAIFACITLIAVFWAFPSASPIEHHVLVLEWGAILAFSVSWFLKGSVHLKRAVGLGWREGSVHLIETARRWLTARKWVRKADR